MRELRKLAKKNLEGEVAIVRIDLNIDPREARYSPRVSAIISTIRFLRSRGARVVLISHRGRPHGKIDLRLSLRPFTPLLSREFKERVEFIGASSLSDIKKKVNASKANIILLENIRFFKGEEEGNKKVAQHLAELGSMYVNDAFAVSHRANASIYVLARLLPSYAGLLLATEVLHLSRIARTPKRPLVVVIGGQKFRQKSDFLSHLSRRQRYFFWAALWQIHF